MLSADQPNSLSPSYPKNAKCLSKALKKDNIEKQSMPNATEIFSLFLYYDYCHKDYCYQTYHHLLKHTIKKNMVRWCSDLCRPASSLSCISRSQVRRRNTLISAKRDTFTQGKQNQRATPYDAHSCPYMPHVLIMNSENHGNEIKTHRSNRGVPGWQKKSLLVCRWINKFSETLAGDQNEYVKDFFADFKGLQSHKV